MLYHILKAAELTFSLSNPVSGYNSFSIPFSTFQKHFYQSHFTHDYSFNE